MHKKKGRQNIIFISIVQFNELLKYIFIVVMVHNLGLGKDKKL